MDLIIYFINMMKEKENEKEDGGVSILCNITKK